MISDTIPFSMTLLRTALPPGLPELTRPDVAIAALPLLRRVRDALRLAGRFRDRCRALETRSPVARWGVPTLFFFNADLQREWESVRQTPAKFPEPFAKVVAKTDPIAAKAWADLPGLLDDVLCVLTASVEARHAARATDGLQDAANALALDHTQTAKLAAVLAVVDDEVVRVIDPENRTSYRVLVRGIANVDQFQTLLAQWTSDARIAESQFFQPSALQPDATLLPGFRGSDHWVWGRESLRALPRVNGERIVMIGEPTMNTRGDGQRPLVNGEVEMLEVIGSEVGQRELRAA